MIHAPRAQTIDGIAPAVAIELARNALQSDPVQAELQAREALRVLPDDIRALCVIGIARRLQADLAASRDLLTLIVARRPDYAPAQVERAVTLAALGEADAALAAWRTAERLRPPAQVDWLQAAIELGIAGAGAAVSAARADHFRQLTRDFDLLAAADALRAGRARDADIMLQARLQRVPDDAHALSMAAETALLCGSWSEAERRLSRCLEIAPDLTDVRYRHACLLFDKGDHSGAADQVKACSADRQARPDAGALMAACLLRLGPPDQAVALSSALVASYPWHARLWILHGQILQTIGRNPEAGTAFSRARALRPDVALTWELSPFRAGCGLPPPRIDTATR
jgi:tetratricopeptide (TPR) repeat protein